jgi:hypothetical protein
MKLFIRFIYLFISVLCAFPSVASCVRAQLGKRLHSLKNSLSFIRHATSGKNNNLFEGGFYAIKIYSR